MESAVYRGSKDFGLRSGFCFVVLFVQFQAYKRSVVVGDSDIPGSVVAYHHGQELVQAGTSPGYVVVLSLFVSLYRCLFVQDFNLCMSRKVFDIRDVCKLEHFATF